MLALAAPVLDVDMLVDSALEARRDELLKLIRQRVGHAVDEFVADVLEARGSPFLALRRNDHRLRRLAPRWPRRRGS